MVGYNSGVNSPATPKPASDNKHRHRHSIYAAEATGLLLMAVLLLVLTIIRYWREIPLRARWTCPFLDFPKLANFKGPQPLVAVVLRPTALRQNALSPGPSPRLP